MDEVKISFSDSELLDAVKAKLGKRLDSELAEVLRVSRTVICEVRSNRRGLPDYTRVLAFDLLEYWWAKFVLKYVFHDDVDMTLLSDEGES